MGDVGLSVGNPKRDAPTGWSWLPLASVARMESGHTPSRKRPDYWGGDIPWIGIKDAKRFHGSEISETLETTNERGIANSSARILPKGTVCLSRTASVGYVVKMGRDMATSQDFANWVCSNRLDPDFLVHLLLAEGGAFSRFSSGSVHQTIYYPELKAFHICLPPLEEQRRIVAILDEAFEGLDRARANAEANLQSARELFDNALIAIFDDVEAYADRMTLQEASVAFGRGRSRHRPRNAPFLYGGPYPFIQTGDIRNSDGTVSSFSQTYSDAGLAQSKLWPAGTICITIAANIAETAVLGFDACFPDSIIGMVTNNIKTFPEYVEFMLRFFAADLKEQGKGSAQDNINLATFELATFPFPNLQQQRDVVEKLTRLAEETARLSDGYVSRLRSIDQLRQSLLQKAFAGELTSPKPHHVLLPANDNMPLSAQVLALGYSRHQGAQRERTYGHVKAQKLLHLAESVCGYDLGRVPIKDAAGPNDMEHMRRVEDWAKANQVFEFQRRPSGGYTFLPLTGVSQSIRNLQAAPENRLSRLMKIIDLLVPMDSEEAEVLATVHAAWSNLIKDGAEITDELIVTAAREDWHPEKMKIARFKFFDAIKTIKAASIEPDGTAQYVGTRQGKLL